jgi:hypothetical protein
LGLLTLSVGVLALWVRSLFFVDVVEVRSVLQAISVNGRLIVTYYPAGQSDEEYFIRLTAERAAPALNNARTKGSDMPTAWGWGWDSNNVITITFAPHWFVALVFAALAFALKPKPRLRFSLSDLLVLTTFAAVLVAGVAGLSRLAS